MQEQLAELRARLLEVDDLNSAAAVLNWDQSTSMPPGGAAARGRQIATLARLSHEKATDPAVGALLEAPRGRLVRRSTASWRAVSSARCTAGCASRSTASAANTPHPS